MISIPSVSLLRLLTIHIYMTMSMSAQISRPLPVSLLQQISIIIRQTSPHLDFILDSNFESEIFSRINKAFTNDELSAFLIVDNHQNFTQRWQSKYHKLCSLVLFNYYNSSETLINDDLKMNLPGAPHLTFYILFCEEAPTDLEAFKDAVKYTQNLVLVSNLNSNFLVLHRPNWNVAKLTEIGSFNVESELLDVSSLELFPKYPNYGGDVIQGLACPICGPKLQTFLETGIWEDYMIATMYYTSGLFNATLEVESLFSVPQDGLDENGDWDDFVRPLLSGAAAFSAIIKPTNLNTKFIFTSKPVYYDKIGFIYPLPKQVKFGTLTVLKHPLSNPVWIGIGISMLGILVCIEFFIFWQKRKLHREDSNDMKIRLLARISSQSRMSKHFWYFTAFATTLPLLDQNGLANLSFKRSVRDSFSRLVLGLWFLMLIVIGCAYKSKFISTMVLPRYIYPPRNFVELIDATDYKINAIFYTNLVDKMFALLHDRIGEGILARAEDLPYINNECYHSILETRSVCLGFIGVFSSVGLEYLTDVHRNSLFLVSQDFYFHFYAGVGISFHFPYLLGPFNHLVRTFESMGLYKHWYDFGITALKKKGQGLAQELQKTKKLFDPNLDTKKDDSKLFIIFMWKLLLLGVAGGSASLLGEFILSFIRSWNDKVTILR